MRKVTTLLSLALSLSAFCQWSNDPLVNNRVTSLDREVYEWTYGVNSDNSITTVFLSPGTNWGEDYYNIEMLISTYDKDGKAVIADDQKVVASGPTMSWCQFGQIAMRDNDDNMLVAYKTYRSAFEQGLGTCVNIDLYKVSPTGELLWDEPLDICRGNVTSQIYFAVSMAQIEDGSYFVAYAEWLESGINNIYIERVSADGELMWDEPLELADSITSYSYPYLINAGDNQVWLMFAKGTNEDLVVRKIDFDGESVLDNDITIYRGGFGSIPIWTFLEAIPDGDGGLLVSWYDDRYFTEYEKSYVSHILSDGSYAYASGIEGEAVGYNDVDGFRSFAPKMLWDKGNKILYTLRRETSSSESYQRLVIQKQSESGELLWDVEGIEVRPDDGQSLGFLDLEFAEDGNVVAFWMEQEGGYDTAAVAHKFNAETGEPMWENDIVFTGSEGSRSDLSVTPLIDGKYWVALWEDNRVVTEEDEDKLSMERNRIFMQRINIDGTFGEPTSVEMIENDANISVENGSIIAPEGSEVYSLDGVCRNAENLTPGIYIVRCGNNVKKVVVNAGK